MSKNIIVRTPVLNNHVLCALDGGDDPGAPSGGRGDDYTAQVTDADAQHGGKLCQLSPRQQVAASERQTR